MSGTPGAPARALAFAALAATAVALGVGLALGALAWSFSVIGLAAIVLGLAVGVALATLLGAQAALAARGPGLVLAALVPVLVGWSAQRVIEDDHIVTQHRVETARVRLASSGLAPAERQRVLGGSDADALDFWARGAEAELDVQVVAAVGFDGVAGRWWWLAGNGVRLAGSWVGARGLPVGRAGALVWALAELGLATWIATRVVARARSVRTP